MTRKRDSDEWIEKVKVNGERREAPMLVFALFISAIAENMSSYADSTHTYTKPRSIADMSCYVTRGYLNGNSHVLNNVSPPE